MSTPVDAMLGELGWKRVEWELDKRVERWGFRLMRGRKVEGEIYGEEWRKRGGEGSGVYEGGWVGRLLRGVKKHRLGGERWEIEKERLGKREWKGVWGGTKEERKAVWLAGREGRERDWVLGMSDASKEWRGLGIGGGVWEKGKRIGGWSKNGGMGLTVDGGEMWGVSEVLKWVVEDYKGTCRKLVVGTDNVGVVKKLMKGRGWCGEMEQRARRWGILLERMGWEVVIEWVPGHVGIEENEQMDEEVKWGVYEEEDKEVGNLLMWSEWESRRKAMEARSWKEFWVRDRKGEEYFGSGGGGELGHNGERWFSRMLVWLRTNHGAMSGARYFEGRGSCVCGELESRDHYVLYCECWKGVRERVWKGWDKGVLWDDGWVDMERLLFGENGVKRLKEFGVESDWRGKVWKSGRWSKKEDREGLLYVPVVKEVGGWMGGMSEERRRREADLRRERKRRYRKRVKEGLVGLKRNALAPIASANSGRGNIEVRGDRIVDVRGLGGSVNRRVLGVLDGNVRKGSGLRKERGE